MSVANLFWQQRQLLSKAYLSDDALASLQAAAPELRRQDPLTDYNAFVTALRGAHDRAHSQQHHHHERMHKF